ncbi:HEAT repeat domain-containing protein [Nannocystis radixulma]|uniref:HEAT repeat domain-containing protein n=1 Tax=Nannocystis radixulma TaxID=2995305 RepID=A0ABT5B3B0_9BACT|nr:HEAT repeat domain-containing protein [Nannocystis radixulma]MDC0668155.1 HEAT repeat domain-containing protein [Nannocystis radixulma]
MTASPRDVWFEPADETLPPPERLRAALADPATRAAGLLHLQARLADTGDSEALAELATLLPTSLAGLAPALQLRLAALYRTLWTWREEHVLPDWRAVDPEPAVARAWLQLELAALPARFAAREADAHDLAALRGLAGEALLEPATLLPVVCGHPRDDVRREGLRLLRECLHAGLCAPALAAEQLLVLLVSGDATLRRDALRELAEPWACAVPCPRALLLPRLADDDEDVACAAVRVAAARDLDADLRALAEDDSAGPRVRAEALAQGMAGSDRDALPAWLALACHDVVLFGPAGLQALRALHRRAVFVGDDELPAVLELATGDHTLDLAELAALCFTARKPLLRRLAAVPADDPRWSRLLPLLCALDSDEVPQHLHALLAATGNRLLRRQLLRELGPHGDHTSEAVVLAHLEHEPATCVAALRWLGGAATIAALSEGLGLHDEAGVRPHLCDVAGEAAALLWHLVDADAPARVRLRARLNFAALPTAILRDLEHPPTRIDLELLFAGLPEPVSVRALERLGRVGGAAELPLARELLARIVSEIVAGVLIERDGHPVRIEPGPVRASEAERQLPGLALQAVRHLGERLHARGAVRPACLLAAHNGADAGARVLADLLLDLDAGPLDPESRAIVLRALASLPGRQIRRHLHRHLRDPDPRVRAAAVTCLSRHVPDDLCATLVKLAGGDDLPTARQALLALAEARATAAAPAIAAWLEHPNMNLKKTAAEALRRAGTPAIAPVLVRWLGVHDNPGLRAALSTALAELLGDAATPALLAALDGQSLADPQTPARWRLWLLALDGRLDAPAVWFAARRGAPWLPTLLGLLARREVHLRRGDLAGLAARLHRHGLHHGEFVMPPPAPLRPGVRALRDRGLHDDTRLALLEHPDALTVDELAVVRPYLRDWLLALTRPHGAGALSLVLQLFAAGLDERAQADCAAHVDALAAWLDDGPREPLLQLLDAVLPRLDTLAAWRLAESLRRSAPRPNLSSRSWLERLRRCGAVLVRADLERALHDCAATPDPAALTRAVLRDAFPGLAALAADELQHRDRLAEQLRAGADARELLARPLQPALLRDLYPDVPPAQQGAWLDRLLQLQPLDVPDFQPPAPASARHQPPPRSAAALARLLARLAGSGPHDREHVADLLLGWPEPAAQRAVLAACLEGHVLLDNRRASRLGAIFAAEHAAWIAAAEHDLELRARVVPLCNALEFDVLLDLVPTLIRWWAADAAGLRHPIAASLRWLPAARLLPHLEPRLRAGEWGCLDLLAQPTTLPPAWRDLLARAPDHAARLREHAATAPLAARDRPPPLDLKALRTPLPAPAGETATRTVAELRARLPTADPEQIRQDLKDMSSASGSDWLDLLAELVGHASPRVRLQAHRLLRTAGDRLRYLDATLELLDDPDPNIQRTAIRAVSHGGHAPAVAPLVARLAHDRDPLHREIAAALRRLGSLAESALARAARDARPDRRAQYEQLLATIAADRAGAEVLDET